MVDSCFDCGEVAGVEVLEEGDVCAVGLVAVVVVGTDVSLVVVFDTDGSSALATPVVVGVSLAELGEVAVVDCGVEADICRGVVASTPSCDFCRNKEKETSSSTQSQQNKIKNKDLTQEDQARLT